MAAKSDYESSMDDDLRNRITKDIRKSGFGSEMLATQKLIADGWDCISSASYFDLDSRITREVDLVAMQTRKLNGGLIYFVLCVEVKKSKQPWVVFKRSVSLDRYTGKLLNYVNISANNGSVEEQMFSIGPWDTSWSGYGVHEAFKEPNQASRSFAATITTCKASDYLGRAQKASLESALKSNDGNWKGLYFVRPIVVLDAPLFSVELDPSGELIVEPIAHGEVRHYFGTDAYESYNYDIDFVALSELESYSKGVVHLLNRMHEAFV